LRKISNISQNIKQVFVRQFAVLQESLCANSYLADLFYFILVGKYLKVMPVCIVSSLRILTGRKENMIKFGGFVQG